MITAMQDKTGVIKYKDGLLLIKEGIDNVPKGFPFGNCPEV